MNEVPSTFPKQENPKASNTINPLVVMVIVFGLPYILTWYFLYSGDPVSFESPNNAGDLISPMIPIGKFNLTTVNNNTVSQDNLKGKWTLFITTTDCNQECEKTLFTLRQTRKALGVNRKVIQPILILQDTNALNSLSVDLSKEFPQLIIIDSANDPNPLLELFSKQPKGTERTIYMADPFGNLMMAYASDSDPKGLLKDLQRLLKVFKPNI